MSNTVYPSVLWWCRNVFEDSSVMQFSILRRQRSDSETFRVPALMAKRTIRIPYEGGWCGVGGAYVCDAATV